MKNFSCIMLFMLLGLLQTEAQEFKQIQNRWKPNQYLHNEGGALQVGPLGAPGWHSAHWEFIPVAGTKFVQIKNRFGNNYYLHNEYGKIQVGPLGNADWWSAQWELVAVPGTEYVQIRNRFRPNQFVHNQNGQIEVGPVGAPGWYSAQWKLIQVSGQAKPGSPAKTTESATGAPPEKTFSYQLSIKTGSSCEGSSYLGEETAGTDSEVSIRLIGTKASSDMLNLNSKLKGDAFEAKQTDRVSFQDRDLGDIVQIEIKKDGQGTGPDWFVDKIDVQKTDNSTQQKSNYTFYLNQWVKTTNSTVFNPGSPPIKYIVEINTSNVTDAGTDANVYLKIRGNKGETDEIRLNSLISGDAFERFKTDKVELLATDVGTISSITIRHDNSHTNPGWHLANVKVYKGSRYGTTPIFFDANRWLESPNLSATLSPGPEKIDMKV
ncbi:MAG: PLAT/LH2 domain-containing protein, partial [Saprospiraceae bacterium]